MSHRVFTVSNMIKRFYNFFKKYKINLFLLTIVTLFSIINTLTLMTAIAVRFFAITVVHDRITFISRNKRFV